MQTFIFSRTCVDHDRNEVDLLRDMIARARPISWGTFKRRCKWRELAVQLGYAVGRTKDLRIEDDYTVGFYASRYSGRPCYYIRWSSIEYIFLEPGFRRSKNSRRLYPGDEARYRVMYGIF